MAAATGQVVASATGAGSTVAATTSAVVASGAGAGTSLRPETSAVADSSVTVAPRAGAAPLSQSLPAASAVGTASPASLPAGQGPTAPAGALGTVDSEAGGPSGSSSVTPRQGVSNGPVGVQGLEPAAAAERADGRIANTAGSAFPGAAEPTEVFWTDLANGMNELLTHTRGVAAFLASVRIEVNTSASKYEAVTRALEKNASLLKEVKDQQKGLAVEVQLLKTSIAANSPEARNEMEQSLLKCKTVYVDALKIAFTDAESTNDVWKGPSGTAGLMAKVVSDTLNVTEDEAAVIVNGRREVPLSAKDAKENRTIPRVVPNAKMFNDRRATFFMQLGQAAVDAWKRKVDFPSDPEEALVAAVRWLNRDKYLKSTTGFEGVVEATVAAFEWLGCKNHFWVDPVDVGDVGHVRALLGHFSFASVKVCSCVDCVCVLRLQAALLWCFQAMLGTVTSLVLVRVLKGGVVHGPVPV